VRLPRFGRKKDLAERFNKFFDYVDEHFCEELSMVQQVFSTFLIAAQLKKIGAIAIFFEKCL